MLLQIRNLCYIIETSSLILNRNTLVSQNPQIIHLGTHVTNKYVFNLLPLKRLGKGEYIGCDPQQETDQNGIVDPSPTLKLIF